MISGLAPAPRSGCVVLPTPDNKIMVYGGYSKEKVKNDSEKGCIHNDMFLLTPDSQFFFIYSVTRTRADAIDFNK